MTVRRAAGALFGRRARLRWLHLVLGGALLMPYYLLTSVGVGPVFEERTLFPASPAAQFTAYAAALPLTALSALFPVVRPLSAYGVRALCSVPGERLADGPARSWAARGRTAAWYVLHLGVGTLISGATLAVPPFAVVLMGLPLFPGPYDPRVGIPDVFNHAWALPFAPVAGVACLLALAATAAAAGALLARAAPALLGPTPADRLADAEARAADLAARNRLARELHDSVGHALSAVTLQAGAARRVLGSDPDFVREALTAIEDTTRRTVGELDAVLGLLRAGEESGGERGSPAPAPTLAADLDGLLARTRAAGRTVDAHVEGDLAGLPALVSREGYRIVQEGLSNALRHAPGAPVTVRVARAAGALDLTVTNPVTGTAPASGGGRGLPGIAERARLLGGTAEAGADTNANTGTNTPSTTGTGTGTGTWTLHVRIPLETTHP